MGVMETKIVQVQNDPRTINESNEAWGRFGWSVLSVQVTHSQDTKTYSGAYDTPGNYTVETTTINYATITYQRDKGMENYARIVELEKEYQRMVNQGAQQDKIPNVEMGCGLLGAVTAICMVLALFVHELFVFVWVFFAVWFFYSDSKARKANMTEVERVEAENKVKREQHNAQLDAIIAEVESLL